MDLYDVDPKTFHLSPVPGIVTPLPGTPDTGETFERWFSRRPSPAGGANGEIVLFHDTFNNFNTPSVAVAATLFLRQAGYRVTLAPKKCCGRPMISKGLAETARENAAYNVAKLAPFVENGYSIVGCEPSCILTLRDEYQDLLPDDENVLKIAQNSYMVDEFLSELQQADKMDIVWKEGAGPRVLFHGHCHQKALIGTGPSLRVLRLPPGFEVEEVDSGCCGMAGTFGYDAEHYDLSMRVGELKLFPVIRDLAIGNSSIGNRQPKIASSGAACRMQIKQGTGVEAVHPILLVAACVKGKPKQNGT